MTSEPQQQVVKRPHVFQESSQQYVDAPYKHQEFPKCKYHAQDAELTRVVNSKEEEKALGPEWQDTRRAPEGPASHKPVAKKAKS